MRRLPEFIVGGRGIIATIYRHCGIDPEKTQLIDPTGRACYLLEHRKSIAELL